MQMDQRADHSSVEQLLEWRCSGEAPGLHVYDPARPSLREATKLMVFRGPVPDFTLWQFLDRTGSDETLDLCSIQDYANLMRGRAPHDIQRDNVVLLRMFVTATTSKPSASPSYRCDSARSTRSSGGWTQRLTSRNSPCSVTRLWPR